MTGGSLGWGTGGEMATYQGWAYTRVVHRCGILLEFDCTTRSCCWRNIDWSHPSEGSAPR
jgi:hypothetical protein